MSDEQALWRQVLLVSISDAVQGTIADCPGCKSGNAGFRENRVKEIIKARRYLTDRNEDFDTVCYLAGLDPEVTRERLRTCIGDAPTPEHLAGIKHQNGKKLTFNGETRSVAEWAKLSGVDAPSIYYRLRTGWTAHQALTTPVAKRAKGKAATLPNRLSLTLGEEGVTSDFSHASGTGGGTTAQDSSKITFLGYSK